MSDSLIKYELPILDIIAVIIALIAVFVALISIYLCNQTRINTGNTVDELSLNREELVKIKFLLAKLNSNFIEN